MLPVVKPVAWAIGTGAFVQQRSTKDGQRFNKFHDPHSGKFSQGGGGGRPKVVPPQEYQDKFPPEKRIYRGVKSPEGAAATRRGELGGGDFGKGIYFGDDIATAQVNMQAFQGDKKGVAIRAGINDGAKIRKPPSYIADGGSAAIDKWSAEQAVDVVSVQGGRTLLVKNPSVLTIDARNYTLDETVVLDLKSAGYDIPDGYEKEIQALAADGVRFNKRFNKFHDPHSGKFAPKGGSALSTKTSRSDLSPEGQAAVDANNAKYGVTQAGLEAELESQINPQAIEVGKTWFPDARQFNEGLAEKSGLSVEQTTAITALTSPRTPWPRNKVLAERVAMTHSNYDDIKDPRAAAKAMGGGLSSNLGPAIAVARGASIDANMTGVKRRSFYNNMLKPGKTRDVTVDTHMQRTAMNSAKKPMTLDQSLDYLNAGKKATGGAGAGYIAIADATRAVADRHGISPDELQSAYWIGISGSTSGSRPGGA